MNKRTMVPFVKWVGGKRKVIPHIEKLWPKSFNTYYEPFVGGGAVLFHFQPENAVINDLNKELINLYKVIESKMSHKRLREYLLLMEHGHHVTVDYDEEKQKEKKHSPFYKVIASIDRNEKGEDRLLSLSDASRELRAARFIFLNKNSFNGLYRVNKAGLYNTPSKHIPTKTFDEANVKNVSEYLNECVEIKNQSFSKSVDDAMANDFVYFDPPYDYEKGQKGFDAYQENGFGIEGQLELANLCKELDKKGVKFMVSNHNTKLIRDMYKKFNIKVIKVKRLVGGKGAKRDFVEEVLVTNYE